MGQMGGQQPMIQGPIAGYGGAQTPFQVQGPQPGDAGAASDKGRTQSHRVYALVLGVVFLVGVATLAAVWLRPGKGVVEGGETVATNSTAPVVNTTTEKKPRSKARRGDTGEPAAAPEPRRSPPSGGGSKKSSGGSTAAASSAPPAPRTTSNPASLTITLAGAAGISGVEVSCPSGFRDRKSISSGHVVFSGVPKEACTLFFRGAAMAKYYPVSGGQNLSCTISGTQGLCN